MDYAVDELMVVAMARELRGEVLVSAVTAMGMLAALVAKATHAPDLALLATPESGMDAEVRPSMTLGGFFGYAGQGIPLSMEDVFDAVFSDRFRIWISPAQVDRDGHANISCIGPWRTPKVALVGARGIPEDSTHLSHLLFYIPRHSPRTLVARVDFRSGAGYPEAEPARPTTLVTDLGVFRWTPEGAFQVESLHPGVAAATVVEQTGFSVLVPEAVAETRPPSAEELQLIRALDPLEVRKIEFLGGQAAAERWADVYARERELFAASLPDVVKRRP